MASGYILVYAYSKDTETKIHTIFSVPPEPLRLEGEKSLICLCSSVTR